MGVADDLAFDAGDEVLTAVELTGQRPVGFDLRPPIGVADGQQQSADVVELLVVQFLAPLSGHPCDRTRAEGNATAVDASW